MIREFCSAKIHMATITRRSMKEDCAIEVDATLLKAAGIMPFEKVQVLNANNGRRVELYARPTARNSRDIIISGPATRWFEVGDAVIILSFCFARETDTFAVRAPRAVFVDRKNRITKIAHA